MTSEKNLHRFDFQDEKVVFQCSIFQVKEKIAHTKNKEHQLKVYTLNCSNWVNVVPVTSTGEIVLVEQHRFGSDSFILEVPGGAVHYQEKDATLAGLRELEEETGLTSKRILSLSSFYPNPAIQNNRVTNLLAFDVQPLIEKSNHFDPFEEIKIHLYPVKEVMQMVRSGQISHALSALALLLAEPYLLNKFPDVSG
jgi:ADP-ribose pyrophosphatase